MRDFSRITSVLYAGDGNFISYGASLECGENLLKSIFLKNNLFDIVPDLKDFLLSLKDEINDCIPHISHLISSEIPTSKNVSVHVFTCSLVNKINFLVFYENERKIIEPFQDVDSLTGLKTKSVIPQFVAHKIKLRREGKFQIILIGIHNLQEIKSTFGARSVDTIVKSVAHRIKNSLRESSYLFRFGSNKFALISQMDEGDNSEALPDRLLQRISKSTHLIHGKRLNIGCSFVAADFHATANFDFQRLLSHTEIKLASLTKSDWGHVIFLKVDDQP